MTKEGKICHDSAYPLSRVKTNVWLIRDKHNKKDLTSKELLKRLGIIEAQNNKLGDYIDELYTLCKTLRNEKNYK